MAMFLTESLTMYKVKAHEFKIKKRRGTLKFSFLSKFRPLIAKGCLDHGSLNGFTLVGRLKELQ